MDFIFIDDMRVEAHVGIFEREKAAPQTLEISLTFGVPDEAAQDDDIDKTIRYDAVIDRIRAELALRHFNLLETLGEYVISMLLNEFGAPWVKISIAKMGIMKGVRVPIFARALSTTPVGCLSTIWKVLSSTTLMLVTKPIRT